MTNINSKKKKKNLTTLLILNPSNLDFNQLNLKDLVLVPIMMGNKTIGIKEPIIFYLLIFDNIPLNFYISKEILIIINIYLLQINLIKLNNKIDHQIIFI
jgi:hypothetical protein